MASGGGYQPNKQAKSEPKRRSNWQRSVSSDRDDTQSLNSLPSDIRINNWDLADLRPTNLGGDSKRRKKSKGNPEREREQSLSVDSPPHEQKHHTPSSYPRTKITPSTPTSQRVALENLKQHMTFSDLDDQISTDGERNNERRVSHSRRRLHNASFNRTDSENDAQRTRERHINRNNNMDYTSREQGPDSNEIVARLMQIRDFMKQARSMLESMEKLGDRKKAEDIEKVRRLIRNLQEQEQGYRGLLQNTLTQPHADEDGAVGGEDDTMMKVEMKDDSDDDTSVDLEVRTEESETTENSQDSRPRIESKLGIGSDDDDGEEEDQYEEPLRGAAENSSGNANCNRVSELENTLVSGQQFTLPGVPVQESEEGARGATAIDGEGPSSQHQELLKILQEKQQQLKDLMSRQEELNLKRRETEKKLLDAQARDNKARAALAAVSSGRQFVEQRLAVQQALTREVEAAAWADADGDDEERGAVGEDHVLKSNIVGYPESDDEDNSNVREVETLPNELLELKRQLNFLRNEFSQIEAPKNVESMPPALVEGRQQLQNKLQELQDKKSRMDSLLQELQMLHSQPLENLRNNETNPQVGSGQLSSTASSNIPAPRPAQQQQQTQEKQQARQPAANLAPTSGMPVNLQARMNDMAASAPVAVESAMATFAQLAREAADDPNGENMDPQMVEDMQEKLSRLREVRGQLDQLRGLVQYYQNQGQKDEREAVADGDDQSSLRGFSDSGDRATLSRQVNADARGSRSSLQQQQQKQLTQQQHLQELLRLQQQQQQPRQPQQQQRQQGAEGGGAGSSSLHSMAQLLNLAGTDQADEHSDEDNASVSQSESQWSHLGPWDDDPEIQEKVKKLKAAKEKLRQLQDLVAFVQQSPDAARALPEGLGDVAASVEGEAVSQATQTDEPNVSVSEGEIPSDSIRIPQREDEMDGLENPREELERLRKERAMLLEIQSQLKQIHNQIGRAPGAQGSELQERGEENTDLGKSGSEQAPNATVVTFASNDELYSKMRRQRILREELRSKKKELEAIMKKDRNKRQYSRNQDNQSDTVSLNTDTFGIPASVDATMATWGGSTVDNLENITEDEDGQERNDRSNREEDNDEDDGYPSDGIVQVEEEEEENDSDNGTYTIEADARQRKNLRKGTGMGLGARPKTSRGRQTYPQPAFTDKNVKKASRKQNRSSRSQRDSKLRQENFRSAQQLIQDEDLKEQNSEWFHMIEDRLTSLGTLVEALLRKSENEGRQLSVSLSQENAPQGSSLISPMQEQMLQLQNQSMMLSFGQLVQSLTRQQGDMQHLQQQMQALQLQVQECQHEHSFQGATGMGLGSSHLMRPAMSNPTLNSSNFNLQATTAVGIHSHTLNHQPMPSPFTQNNLNNTAPATYFGGFPTNSPGLRNVQHGALGLSNSNLSLGGDRGASGTLGTGLTVNTGSSLSLPQQTSATGFVFNPMGQSTLNAQGTQHHETSQAGTSVSALSRDFSQFVNTLQSTPPPSVNSYGQFSNLFGSSSQQQQQAAGGTFPLLSSRLHQEGNEIEDENPVPRLNSYTFDSNRNKKRKMGSGVKKSESDPTSGLRISTPKVENLQGRGEGVGSSHVAWERDVSTDYRINTGGAGFADVDAAAFDAGSSYSSIQSIRDQHARLSGERTQAKSADTSADGNTLFDTLRDTIYTEVASLISQNESRPHFLLELFRDMRQIDSDLMRQRTLFSMQELLRANTNRTGSSSAPSWTKTNVNPADLANSEQTPSESMTSEDDEDLKVTRLQEEITAAERSRLDRLARNRALRNFPFDYAETADNPSSLSTPTNGCEESPFFQDTLGETVIEFDSLKREEEERQHSSQGRFNRQSQQSEDGRRGQRYGRGSFLASELLLKDMRSSRPREERRARGATGGAGLRSLGSQSSEVASSSAMDQASESSISDMPYPRIDMQQLDRQIKDIMMETIPVVKEHMDDVCSTQLLSYIKRLVLSLTSQMGNQEFARFFQRQLASILEDTLQKYEGRKMRDCGEDLLVEVSDVLFNELAFFKLMQDLDDPSVAGKIRAAEWPSQVSNAKDDNPYDYSASSSSAAADDDDDEDGDNDDDENKNDDDNNDGTQDNNAQRGFRITEAEQDELGRERDDEMAKEVSIRDSEEKDDDDTEQSYKIELAPSETKPFTRIGSDEDDDEGDEERSMDDPSETAVSRDSMMETNGESQPADLPSTRPETEGAGGDGVEKQDQEKPISPTRTSQPSGEKLQGDGDGVEDVSTNASTVVTDTTQMNGTVNGGNNSDEELTVDDLPERLTVHPTATVAATATANSNNNSLELRRRYEEEQRTLVGIDGILASMQNIEELAGDGTAIVDPDSFLS